MKIRFPVGILPLIATAFMIGGLLTTYGLTVGLNHTQAAVPFISDTGVTPPENGIFTIVLVCSAFQFILISTIRFKQIWDNIMKNSCYNIAINIINIIAYCISYVSGVGLILVGSYTSNDTLVVHLLGAVLGFVFVILYFAVQTGLSIFVEPQLKLRWVLLSIRVAMLLFSLGLLVLYLSYYGIDSGIGQDSIPTTDNAFTVISPIAQWLLIFVIFGLFLTLIPEFHSLDVHIRVLIKRRDGTTNEVPSLVTVNEAQSAEL